jgi:hypothetical protein
MSTSATTALTNTTSNTLQDLFYVSGIFGFLCVSYIKYRELKLLRMSVGLNTLQFGSNIVRRLSIWGNSVLPSIQRYLQPSNSTYPSNFRNNRNYSDILPSQLLLNQNLTHTHTHTPTPTPTPSSQTTDLSVNRQNRLSNVQNSQTQSPPTTTSMPASTQISTSNNGNVITATTTGEFELDSEQIMNMLLGIGGLTNRNSNNRDRDRDRDPERSRNRDRSNTNDRIRPRGDSTANTAISTHNTSSNNTSSNS